MYFRSPIPHAMPCPKARTFHVSRHCQTLYVVLYECNKTVYKISECLDLRKKSISRCTSPWLELAPTGKPPEIFSENILEIHWIFQSDYRTSALGSQAKKLATLRLTLYSGSFNYQGRFCGRGSLRSSS